MAVSQFSAPYQSIYEAGIARQRALEARKRAMALSGAQRAGVATSGVSQLPQQEITTEAMRGEAELGAEVGRQAEAERLADKAYAQRKELTNISIAAEAEQRALDRKNARRGQKAGIAGQVIGAGLGAWGSYLGKED